MSQFSKHSKNTFAPPWWAGNAHVQTILPVLLPLAAPNYTRERWDTPDDDFIDVDWVGLEKASQAGQPIVILFHGLEGSSQSAYAKALMHQALRLGWSGVVVHWRSCSGEMNRQRVMYHSGFSAEIDWIVRRIGQRFPQAQLCVAGVSLGGNALLKWLGEQSDAACAVVRAACSICAPHDLKAGAVALQSGFNQRVYMRNFLGTLKKKAHLKLRQFPDLPITPERIRAARDFFDVDNDFTAPLHGFRDAEDYWQKSSSKPFMRTIAVPTWVLNTADDPIVPQHSWARADEVSAAVELGYVAHGGHVGFVHVRQKVDDLQEFGWMPAQVCAFFKRHLHALF